MENIAAQTNGLHKLRRSSIPRSAPWFAVPQTLLVGIEHPCMISNMDKAVATLGGEKMLQKVILILSFLSTFLSEFCLACWERKIFYRSKTPPPSRRPHVQKHCFVQC